MGKMSKKILAGLLAVVLVLGGILLYNLQMNKSFITTFYSVTVDKPVEDLRIVLLSDLHLHEAKTMPTLCGRYRTLPRTSSRWRAI